MKILLTGASGFAGAHMLKRLLTQEDFHIVCPITYSHGGNEARLRELFTELELKQVCLIKCDLAKQNLLEVPEFENIDLVINFASESHVDRSISSPVEFTVNNNNLMINLLELLRVRDVKMFLHMSTDEVYGSLSASDQNIEWQSIYKPGNPYSASKAAQENLAVAYYNTYKLPIVIINATNMIGLAQNREKFVPKVISKIINKETIQIDTDEFNQMGSRKYISVRDVTEAVMLVVDKFMNGEIEIFSNNLPQKFHVAGSRSYTNLEIVSILENYVGQSAYTQTAVSPRPGYDLSYEMDCTKIKSIGWTQKYTVEEELKNITQWSKQNLTWLQIDHISGL